MKSKVRFKNHCTKFKNPRNFPNISSTNIIQIPSKRFANAQSKYKIISSSHWNFSIKKGGQNSKAFSLMTNGAQNFRP